METGLVDAGELANGRSSAPSGADVRRRVLRADRVEATLRRGGPVAMDIDQPPRFGIGDRVRVRNRHPRGHTRAPRYTRGRSGIIARHHGAHVFPDLHAAGRREARHLYSVRFEHAELWGDDDRDGRAAGGAVYVDLWQPYLEPAE
jgi:nitrile hydratase